MMRHLSPALAWLAPRQGPDGGLLLPVLLGVVASALLVAAASINPKLALAVAVGLPAACVLATRPRAVTLLLILCLLILEEFPSGQGETAERATRTAFYARSLGIPGVYAPDLLLIGALGLWFGRLLLLRRPLTIPLNRITLALLLVGIAMTASIGLSLAFDNPLANVDLGISGVLYEVNARGARLIAFFQFKNFALIFPAYLLGLFYFQNLEDVRLFKWTALVAVLASIVIGVVRLGLDPSIVAKVYPLFYHSPTSWFFGLAAFFLIGLWVYRRLGPGQTAAAVLTTLVLMLFILLSFRRTMWGAIGIAAIAYVWLIHKSVRGRYYFLLALGGMLAGIAMVAFPPLLEAVAARVSETSSHDLSTLYRMALFLFFADHVGELPVFGYGVRPLWDLEASIGYFRTNVENIHSLYFWILLRMGWVGILAFLAALALIVWYMVAQLRSAVAAEERLWVAIWILALLMFLFSGVFNPVYAEVRYVVLLGFGLGMLARLPQIRRAAHGRRAGAL